MDPREKEVLEEVRKYIEENPDIAENLELVKGAMEALEKLAEGRDLFDLYPPGIYTTQSHTSSCSSS